MAPETISSLLVMQGIVQSANLEVAVMPETISTRRSFLQSAGASALASQVLAQTSSASGTGMPTRILGRTGVRVSILGIGGAHAGRGKDEAECIRLIQTALDEGITFMDNAWEYSRGRCEDVMGKALAMDGRRKKAFLMTKVCSREYAGAMQQLEESLKRLQTDYLDLWQFHECNYHNDPDWVFEKGAVKAAIEARKQGKVRFIGFTGHKAPSIHLRMLSRRFDWDTAQMPNNVMDAGFESFSQEVMPVCLRKNVGVIGMKGCGGDGRMIDAGIVTLEECYRYCLSQPVAVQVVGLSNLEMLNTALRLGREFKPLSAAGSAALQAKVKEVQGDGRYELFKSSKRYDSAFHRQQHGFDVQGNL
jgi:predicted aldo/keto reductase-like oxidoreductase